MQPHAATASSWGPRLHAHGRRVDCFEHARGIGRQPAACIRQRGDIDAPACSSKRPGRGLLVALCHDTYMYYVNPVSRAPRGLPGGKRRSSPRACTADCLASGCVVRTARAAAGALRHAATVSWNEVWMTRFSSVLQHQSTRGDSAPAGPARRAAPRPCAAPAGGPPARPARPTCPLEGRCSTAPAARPRGKEAPADLLERSAMRGEGWIESGHRARIHACAVLRGAPGTRRRGRRTAGRLSALRSRALPAAGRTAGASTQSESGGSR